MVGSRRYVAGGVGLSEEVGSVMWPIVLAYWWNEVVAFDRMVSASRKMASVSRRSSRLNWASGDCGISSS